MKILTLMALCVMLAAQDERQTEDVVDASDLTSILAKKPQAALRFCDVNLCSDPRIFWPITTASPSPVLVCFTTAVCPVCVQQKPFLERFAKLRTDVLVLVVDANAAPDIALRYGVRTVPHLVAIRNGVVMGRSTVGRTDAGLDAWFTNLGMAAPVIGLPTAPRP